MEKETSRLGVGYVEMRAEKRGDDGTIAFSVEAKLILTDEENDLALFKIDANAVRKSSPAFETNVLEVSNSDAEVGEDIVVSGFHSEWVEPFTSIGTVSIGSGTKIRSNSPEPLHSNTILCDLTTLPGNSGSPILSLKSGKVVGVVIATVTPDGDRTRMSVATNRKALVRLLEMHKSFTRDSVK